MTGRVLPRSIADAIPGLNECRALKIGGKFVEYVGFGVVKLCLGLGGGGKNDTKRPVRGTQSGDAVRR